MPTSPVLLLHALGVSRSVWDLSAAPAHRSVDALDLPGHGDAARLSEPTSVDAWAIAVADDIGLGALAPVDLIGMSLGGIVAVSVATNHPELVRSLTLVATVATYPDRMRAMWADRAHTVPTTGTGPVVDPTLHLWFTDQAVRTDRGAVRRVRRELSAISPAGYADACALLATVDIGNRLPRIAAPTLVLGCRQDGDAFVTGAQAIAGAIPGATLDWLPGRHGSALEYPGAFWRSVETHLEQR